jgi:adenine phosphoribosyltransferase
MKYYTLKVGKVRRKLPIVALSPKIKIASFNLLGDRELVEVLAQQIAERLKGIDFDYLVGPEVKVVPLLHELSKLLGKPRYIVCRKQLHGYMVSPKKTRRKPGLVIDGKDVELIDKKKVVILDDVVSSGHTMRIVKELMEISGARVVAMVAVFRQGIKDESELEGLIYLGTLPLF